MIDIWPLDRANRYWLDRTELANYSLQPVVFVLLILNPDIREFKPRKFKKNQKSPKNEK